MTKLNFEAQQEAILRKNKEDIKNNPMVFVNAGEFIKLLSRRCRVCYSKVMFAVSHDAEISNAWANGNLCVTCLVLYKNRQPKEE